MSSQVINLRLARKRTARAAKDAKAAENRRLFGETIAERAARKDAENRREQLLDGAKRADASTPDQDIS